MAKPGAPLKISAILKAQNILLDIKSSAKPDVMRELADLVFSEGDIAIKEEIIGALLDREKLGSTGIGSGVAVPHAKSPRAEKMICAFGISKKGIDFEALDHEPVYIIFLLVAPPNSQSEHLNILARIVQLLKDPALRQALRQAATAQEILNFISAQDA
ncbi:MAG: PTS sugar transporter subunit IIA [Elusimicrobia bacterium]|nr:PTS sugar transporter subunit IIA [Elusimicrobiota bacterium]